MCVEDRVRPQECRTKRVHTDCVCTRACEETGRSAREICAHHLVRERSDAQWNVTWIHSRQWTSQNAPPRTILRHWARRVALSSGSEHWVTALPGHVRANPSWYLGYNAVITYADVPTYPPRSRLERDFIAPHHVASRRSSARFPTILIPTRSYSRYTEYHLSFFRVRQRTYH